MKYNILKFQFILLFILFMNGCTDEIDLENISNKYTYDGGFAVPGIQGTFTTYDMFNPGTDTSKFIFYGEDSIVLSIRRDSAFRFELDDFMDSEQTVSQLLSGFSLPPKTLSNPLGDVGPFQSDAYYSNIASTTFYPSFDVVQEVEIDSLILVSGNMNVDVTSTFEPDIYLIYESNSIFIDGQNLYDSILVTGDGTYDIPLDGAAIHMQQSGTSPSDSVYFDITYNLSLDIESGESLNDGDQAEVTVSMDDIEDYEYIFGYFGNFVVKEFDELDTFSLNLPEMMDNLEGSFNFERARVKLHYRNSFGLDQLIDVGMEATQEDGSKDSATFEPPATLEKPLQYTDMQREDSTTMNAQSLINVFGELPPPKIFSAAGEILINPNGPEVKNGYINFVRPDSRLAADMVMELPMDFAANMLYSDTMLTQDFIDIPDYGDHIEYARIHYLFENGFPMGLDVQLVMLDTINQQHVDTIRFNETGDYFVEGAPVDADGIVSEVIPKNGMMEITQETVRNLKNKSHKVILKIRLETSGEDVNDPVKLQPSNSLYYRMNLEVKITADDYFENE